MRYKSRLDLVHYALFRLPRQLPVLGIYAYAVVYLCERGVIDRSAAGKAGTALVGLLSMVTGLLLSYRFSRALSKWDEGKKVWVTVRSTIRDAVRMISIGDDGAELTGVFVGFAFALQHHLHRTRPQPPLSDLLPVPFLASLKRTEARVRFAEMHENGRPGIKRTPTGKGGKVENWDFSIKADLFALDDAELKQQLEQLNIPEMEKPEQSRKSSLSVPHPNLPLALLKLMEGYVNRAEWADAKKERGLGCVKALSAALGEAERLNSNPPPLPLTLHLGHLLLTYLAAIPVSLLCVTSGPVLVIITLIAGWCLLGLESLTTDVGGVFGQSENHHPLPLFAKQILLESLDVNSSFLKLYRSRLVQRLGEGDRTVMEVDKRRREEWAPGSS